MSLNRLTFSGPEFNPYAPPKASIGGSVTPVNPNDVAQCEPMSSARCIASLLLGSASIILSLLELGLFAGGIMMGAKIPRSSDAMINPSVYARVFGQAGLAGVAGCLGLWLVRTELGVTRSIPLGASALRFCWAGLVATVCDVIFLCMWTIYTWFT
jgi:hypothetical protein